MGFLSGIFGRVSNTREQIADFIAEQSATHDHVLIGEPHVEGSTLGVYSFLADHPEMFTRMADHGIRNFAVEFPNCFQDSFQQLADGQISKDQFVREIESGFETPWANSPEYKSMMLMKIAGAVENAGNAGMKVLAADVTSDQLIFDMKMANSELDDEVRQEYTRISGKAFPEMTGDHMDEINAAIDELPQDFKDEVQRKQDAVNRDFMEHRFDDSEQHDYLINNKAEGGVFGVVGVHHLQNLFGDKTAGIDDLLERDGGKVATFGIYANKEAQEKTLGYVHENGLQLSDGTDYNVILNSGAVYDKGGQFVRLSENPSGPLTEVQNSLSAEVAKPVNHFLPDFDF